MNENSERIAVLEAQQQVMKSELDEIKDGVDEIRTTLQKQRGFWAGVTFAVSIVAFFAKEFWQKLSGPY